MPSANDAERVRNIAQDLVRELEAIERGTVQSLSEESGYRRLAEAIDHCLGQLMDLNLWGVDNRFPSSELWNVAGHWLERGWLQNQARTKPRGYAGDYELLARIYEGQLCDDPLGRLFDRYFQLQAAPQAVRNRMGMVREWIVEAMRGCESAFRVAIVGSAFGLEVRDALVRLHEEARRRVHVTLVDIDPAAIEFAHGRLAPLLGPNQLTAISTNLFRLSERPEVAAALGGSELLVCPGLFDYLDDAAAVAMLRYLYQQRLRGGRMTVFQFAPHNPTRAYMEWFANWYLTYRDAGKLRRVVESAGLADSEVIYGAEPLGIDLFATVGRHRN